MTTTIEPRTTAGHKLLAHMAAMLRADAPLRDLATLVCAVEDEAMVARVHYGDPDDRARAYNQGYDDALEQAADTEPDVPEGPSRSCPACGAMIDWDDTHWSLIPEPAGGYICPVTT